MRKLNVKPYRMTAQRKSGTGVDVIETMIHNWEHTLGIRAEVNECWLKSPFEQKLYSPGISLKRIGCLPTV